MNKLTRTERAEHAKLTKRLRKEQERIDLALAEYNQIADEAFSEYRDRLQNAYARLIEGLSVDSGLAEDCIAFVEDVAARLDDYYENRSDGWRESERGEAFLGWLEAWRTFDLEPLGQLPALGRFQIVGAEAFAELPLEIP